MEREIFYLLDKFPQVEGTLINTINIYGRCIEFFDTVEAYLKGLEQMQEYCREVFQDQFRSTFEEANNKKSYENLSLPAKVIKALDDDLDIFFYDTRMPRSIPDDLRAIEARLVWISKLEKLKQ